MRQWGRERISVLRGSSIGSLHKLSCCAWWRRNNVFSSTSCSGSVMQHSLSPLPAVPCRRVITGAKSLFTGRDNTLSNWLMHWEQGFPLPVSSCWLFLGPLRHNIIDDRSHHLYGRGPDYLVVALWDAGDAVRTGFESELSIQIDRPWPTIMQAYRACAIAAQKPKGDKAPHYHDRAIRTTSKLNT